MAEFPPKLEVWVSLVAQMRALGLDASAVMHVHTKGVPRSLRNAEEIQLAEAFETLFNELEEEDQARITEAFSETNRERTRADFDNVIKLRLWRSDRRKQFALTMTLVEDSRLTEQYLVHLATTGLPQQEWSPQAQYDVECIRSAFQVYREGRPLWSVVEGTTKALSQTSVETSGVAAVEAVCKANRDALARWRAWFDDGPRVTNGGADQTGSGELVSDSAPEPLAASTTPSTSQPGATSEPARHTHDALAPVEPPSSNSNVAITSSTAEARRMGDEAISRIEAALQVLETRITDAISSDDLSMSDAGTLGELGKRWRLRRQAATSFERKQLLVALLSEVESSRKLVEELLEIKLAPLRSFEEAAHLKTSIAVAETARSKLHAYSAMINRLMAEDAKN